MRPRTPYPPSRSYRSHFVARVPRSHMRPQAWATVRPVRGPKRKRREGVWEVRAFVGRDPSRAMEPFEPGVGGRVRECEQKGQR